MLEKIGKLISKKPTFFIILIALITVSFGALIPSLKIGTSVKDFLPNIEEVRANERVAEYFGKDYEPVMVYIEGSDVTSPKALKKQYEIFEHLEKKEGVEEIIGIAFFVNDICKIEYGKSILNCTDKEIENAFHDLVAKENESHGEDGNEREVPDYLDIKSFKVEEDEKNLTAIIEVYNLEQVKSFRSHKVIEWYIAFKNEIVPDERLNMSYRLAVQMAPKPIWQIGNNFFINIKNLIRSILTGEIFEREVKAYLWIKPHNMNQYFPVAINASIDMNENHIFIKVSKEELAKYGIALKAGNFQLPAKLGNISAGSRIYKLPYLRIPLSISFIKSVFAFIQERALFNAVAQNYSQILDMINGSIAIKDFDNFWETVDIAKGEETLLIKPRFMDEMGKSTLTFLPKQFENADKTLAIVQLNGSMNEEKTKELSREIEDFLENYNANFKMKVTGESVITAEIDKIADEANRIIVPGIFIAIILILLLNFRKPSYVFLPLLGLTISIIWLFGTMSLLGIKFNAIAVALIPLIMGLGVDYSVHLFHNYRAEIAKGRKPSEAIVSSVKDIGMAMLLATITTCIGFLSFLTSSVPSIRNFGLLCAIGIIYTFIVTITLLASIRYILDRKKKIEVKERKFIVSHLMKRIANIICKNPKKAMVLVAVFTILFAFGSINLKTEFNMKDFVPKESKSIKIMEKIGNDFPFSSQQQEYILIEGNIASIAVLEEMKKTIANIENDEYVARSREGNARIESIIGIMEKAIEENASLITKYNIKNGLPQTNEDVKAFFDYLYENKEFEREVRNVLYKEGGEYKAALIRVYAQHDVTQEGEKMKKFYEELKEDLAFRNVKAIVTGQITLTHMITSSLTESQIKSTIACIILAGIVLIIAYRRIFYGIVAMLPVAIAAIWILGTIYFIGYSLNVMTVMITSLTIGLGITYAIHAVERYRIMKDEFGYEKAVFDSIYHTGTALFMAALTTIAGFAILIFSPIPPEQQFGIVTAITILYSFIITILLVPSLFLLRKEKK